MDCSMPVLLSNTNSQSLSKPMSIESVMPFNNLILCCPLSLPPSIFPSIRVFSNESALHIRWPKYWSFSFNISPSSEHPGLISFRMTGWISLQSKGLKSLLQHRSSKASILRHSAFFIVQLSQQQMLTIWSLVPLPFLKPAYTSRSAWFTCCWSLAWRILSIILLVCEMSAVVQ